MEELSAVVRTVQIRATRIRRSALSRYLVWLILLVKSLPPSWHIAAVATVELLGDVIMTAGALTAIVIFNIHCFAPLVANAYLH